MVKKSTLLVGIVLLLIAGAGTYVALAIFAPQKTTVNQRDRPDRSSDSPSGNVSDDQSSTEGTASDSDKLVLSRRDTAVKDMMAAVAAGMITYRTNNRGAIIQTEAQLSSFTTNYLTDVDFKDPVADTLYTISLDGPGEGIIYYQPGHRCSDDGLAAVPGSSRQSALTTTLPSGAAYCIEP